MPIIRTSEAHIAKAGLPPATDDRHEPTQGNRSRHSAQTAKGAAIVTGRTLRWRVAGGVVRTMRPHQWVKNVFVLAPLVFAKELFSGALVLRALGAFVIFCALAAAVYTMNDLADAERDSAHPIKCRRPIACGLVTKRLAQTMVLSLFGAAMLAALLEATSLAWVALSYFLLNVAYSFSLKKHAYLDVGCIATGFVLRVLAGGLATNITISSYLFACTGLLALFLGFGKRRHEIAAATRLTAQKQRAALSGYSPAALNAALALTGVASVLAYLAYTLDPHTRAMFHSDWLWLTVPGPLFGMLRFLQLVAHRPRAESPTQEMLRDTPFLLNLLLWIVAVLLVVYGLRPT